MLTTNFRALSLALGPRALAHQLTPENAPPLGGGVRALRQPIIAITAPQLLECAGLVICESKHCALWTRDDRRVVEDGIALENASVDHPFFERQPLFQS